MSKKTTKKKKSDNLDLAVKVSDNVELEDIKLISCECKQTPDAARGKHVINVDLSVETEFDHNNNIIMVFPRVSLEAVKENDNSQIDLNIMAQFVLLYKLTKSEGLTQDNFDAFGKINGVYNAWPYWREFVQNTTARMGLPSLVVPVFRLANPKKVTKKKKTTKK